MNIVDVAEVLAAADWTPGEEINFPGPNPNRDPTPPPLGTP
jgi:hypothetical protein